MADGHSGSLSWGGLGEGVGSTAQAPPVTRVTCEEQVELVLAWGPQCCADQLCWEAWTYETSELLLHEYFKPCEFL